MILQQSVTYARPKVSFLAHIEALTIAVAVCLVLFAAVAVAKDALTPPSKSMTTIVVGQGDTLWSLAKKHGDPHEYILSRVDRIAHANGLSTGTILQPGQKLIVPDSHGK